VTQKILLIYGMQVLSFPIGILVSLILVAVSEFLHLVHAYNYQSSYASIILEWVSWLVAGYWQWFKACHGSIGKLNPGSQLGARVATSLTIAAIPWVTHQSNGCA